MKESSKILLDKYQVRKSKEQKEIFAEWLSSHLKEYGYDVQRDNYSKNGTNLIIGDVKKANVILTAHYDTQANFYFPIFMGFSNWISFFLSQLWTMIPIMLILILIVIVSNWLKLDLGTKLIISSLGLFAYSILMTYSVANKHTANDNTSGVATLLSILEELPTELKEKVCFVFFDEEESGLIGSMAFKKKHKSFINKKPLINFDCVSDGDTLYFVTKKPFRESFLFELLEMSVETTLKSSSKNYQFGSAFKNVYTSDQIIYKNSVGICAAKKLPIFGYYIDRVHTKRDTKFDSENIRILSEITLDFIHKI